MTLTPCYLYRILQALVQLIFTDSLVLLLAVDVQTPQLVPTGFL